MNLQPVREYLGRWRDPRRPGLAAALDHGPEKAALAFADLMAELPLSPKVAELNALVTMLTGNAGDVIVRDITIGADALSATVYFIDGLVKKEIVLTMLESLAVRLRHERLPREPQALYQFLQHQGVVSSEVSRIQSLGDLLSAILSGDAVLAVEGLTAGLRISARGWEHRQPEEPVTEPAVRGPKEGFTETAAVNLSLVRRRLQDPRLRVETVFVGERTSTTVVLVYMAGLTLPELVTEVKNRLKRIRLDGVLESGYLSELISDTTLTPFPMTRATERPDVIAANVLEGKVALIVDGTPHALLVPTLFHEGMQAVEDYYQHWTTASFIRFLRYVYLMVALLGPATYIGLLSFHHEMLPTSLLLSIMRNREGVPFPALVEALLMEISFEALREAGVRLPKNVGQAVSIVGALVIGEAAVRAGIVSPAMVIVVAITGISSFVIPLYSSALAIRLLRFPMMILAGTLGFLGVVLGLIVLSVHLASLRSFGVPYMSPSMPVTMGDLKDMMVRAPWWFMRRRPKLFPSLDRQRMRGSSGPHPPSETGGTSV